MSDDAAGEPSAAQVAAHSDYEPDGVEWVDDTPRPIGVAIVEYDPAWPGRYAELEARIRSALGDRVIAIAHVGSTSVPGLPAKDVIDIDLTVADNDDEAAYRADLESAGTVLRLRERGWHGHRLFVAAEPLANIHVWSPGSPEAVRHRMFREWLLTHPDDRERYVEAKRAAAASVQRGGGDVQTYNERKEPVIRDILDRMFREQGMLD